MDERHDAKGKVLRSQFETAAREIFLELQTDPILSVRRVRQQQARAGAPDAIVI
jgi:hypothetical protein